MPFHAFSRRLIHFVVLTLCSAPLGTISAASAHPDHSQSAQSTSAQQQSVNQSEHDHH